MTEAQTDRRIVCRRCGAAHNGLTAVDLEETQIAQAGDIALCIECACVNVIAEDGDICEQPSADRYDELLGDKWFVKGLLGLTMHLHPEGHP